MPPILVPSFVEEVQPNANVNSVTFVSNTSSLSSGFSANANFKYFLLLSNSLNLLFEVIRRLQWLLVVVLVVSDVAVVLAVSSLTIFKPLFLLEAF